MSEPKKFNQTLVLRRAEVSDENFLTKVYAETRREEFALFGWSEAALSAFVKMQFEFQMQSYAMQFPSADFSVIEFNGAAAGRLIVNRGDEAIRLVDVALLPEFRGLGIGTFLLEQLQSEAAADNKPLTLNVLKTNQRAANLYRRCGFVITGDGDLSLAMEWRRLAF